MFVALPAMEAVYAAQISEVDDTDGASSWSLASRSSDILYLKLCCTDIGGGKLLRLIEGMQRLKTFEVHVSSGRLHAGELCTKLLKYASFSLEYLSLTTHNIALREYLGTLDGFLKTKTLSTYFDILLDLKDEVQILLSALHTPIGRLKLQVSASEFEQYSRIVNRPLDDGKASKPLSTLGEIFVWDRERSELVRFIELQEGNSNAEIETDRYPCMPNLYEFCQAHCIYAV